MDEQRTTNVLFQRVQRLGGAGDVPFSANIMKMVSLRKVMSSVIDRFIVRPAR